MLKILLLTLCLNTALAKGLPLNKTLKPIELSGKAGGKVDGTGWSSKEMLGTAHVLFYVDPDRKDLNEPFSQTLKKRNFPLSKLKTVAIINLDATWLPNFAIENALKEKQKKYPKTTYVKDFDKFLVKQWKLKDDDNDIIVFDKKGLIRYFYFGKMEKNEISKAMAVLEEIVKE